VPAFELIGNVLPTLKPFFEFIAFLSRPENAKVIRQAQEYSERFFREQDRALLAFAVNNPWIGLERWGIRSKVNAIPAGRRTVLLVYRNGVRLGAECFPQDEPQKAVATLDNYSAKKLYK